MISTALSHRRQHAKRLGQDRLRSSGSVMDNEEAESQYLRAAASEERSFDEMARGFADGTTSREQVLKWLAGTFLGGGLLALGPSAAGAKANQNSGRSADNGGAGRDGRRGKQHKGGDGKRGKQHKGRDGKRGKHHGGGGAGGSVHPPVRVGA
jgi:hypothetical protein